MYTPIILNIPQSSIHQFILINVTLLKDILKHHASNQQGLQVQPH